MGHHSSWHLQRPPNLAETGPISEDPKLEQVHLENPPEPDECDLQEDLDGTGLLPNDTGDTGLGDIN